MPGIPIPYDTTLRPSKEFLDGLYVPELVPDSVDLRGFIQDPQADADAIQSQVDAKVTAAVERDPNAPLTEAEALLVDARIDTLIEGLGEARARISNLRELIEKQVAPANGEELSFRIDISKRRSLKRAVAIVFGMKTDTITYSMYKQCLELKRQIETQEAGDYTAGKWED
jgi:hypothetical protein